MVLCLSSFIHTEKLYNEYGCLLKIITSIHFIGLTVFSLNVEVCYYFMYSFDY